jgi:hypothetical protein
MTGLTNEPIQAESEVSKESAQILFVGSLSPHGRDTLSQFSLIEKTFSSRFVRSIGPGSQIGTNYSGPMPVSVLAWTGTDGSPRGHVRSEAVVDHWSRFVARTGIVGLCRGSISSYFYAAAGLGIFFHLFILCFVFNLMVLHIYINNEGATIYIIHHGHEYIIHHLIRRAWSKHITNGIHTSWI